MALHPQFPPLARRARRCEEGSAYMIVLLALVVLTILALSLAFVTQTELQIGGNERATNRVFYAAESGIAAATARALVTADYKAHVFTFTDPGTATLGFTETVDVSPVLPILDAPCNLCEINDAGTYSEKSFRKINHAVTATSVRTSGSSAALAQKTITAMIEVQPWKASPEAYLPLNDPAQLAKIRF
jgi:Tfp pilus assembly protein PilX